MKAESVCNCWFCYPSIHPPTVSEEMFGPAWHQSPPPVHSVRLKAVIKPAPRHCPCSASSPWRVFPTSQVMRPGHIRNNHLRWLLSMRRSKGSTPSSPWVNEVLTISQRGHQPSYDGSSFRPLVSAFLFFWSLPKAYGHSDHSGYVD